MEPVPPIEANDLQAKAWQLHERLLEAYDHNPNIPRRDPMHELISTILSQRTTWQNEDRAYRQMMERFGTWEAIRDAPTDALTEAIAPWNYAEQKAPRIKEVVGRILDEHGSTDLSFLRDIPLDEAVAWLTGLPGVGPKTATLVLLFCFQRPVLPVDTHVHRVSQRVGLIGPKVNPTAAHPLLLALFPPEPQVLYNFHINALRHGQRVCVWGTPRCDQCPLTDICNYYQTNVAGRKAASRVRSRRS